MPTQAQFLAQVRQALKEPVAVAWSDVELRDYINQAASDIARRTETLQERINVAAVAATREYTLPSTVLRVHKVEYQPDDTERIYPMEYHDLHAMDAMWYTQQAIAKGTCQAYTLWGYPPALKLVVYPAPSLPGVFRVHYYAMPQARATDGSAGSLTVTVPSGWDDLVVEYAVYLAFRRDVSPRWQEHKSAYEEHVDDMLSRTRRWSDQGGSIVPNTGQMLPAWLIEGGNGY